MSKKLIHMISFVLVTGLVMTGITKAADPDIIGWWKLDEGFGNTAVDSSGSGADITLQNSTWENGLFGGAVHFGGVGYGNVGSFNYSDNVVTVCAYVWHDAFRSGQVERYVTMAPEVAVIRKETDGRLHFYIKTDDSLRHLWVSDVLTEGQWHHVTGTWDGLTQRLYIDGVEIASQTPGGVLGDTSSVTVSSGDEPLNGMLDEIRIYSRALTEQEIKGVMLGGGAEYPLASAPNPEDGALYEDTWASLSWRAGDFAISHDVYFGDNFDDVDAGAESAFQGNQGSVNFIAGFPGFAYPDGLVPGTTYYWRVDEVNEAEPNSPWEGAVWSFSIPPRTAYNPVPGDGGKFIDPNADLSWTAGFGGKLHTVYFGDNFDDVNNAAGGLPQGITTYALETLEPEKTYYWRVDEFDAITTIKGNIWSFTVAGTGGGIRGNYYQGMNFDSIALTRIDPQINFAWGDGEPDPAVGADNFSCRWTGEVEAAFTETYTFYTMSDDGVRLWIDGQQLVDNWTDHGTTENKGTINLIAGNTYSVVMEMYENDGGAVAELRWSSPHTPKQLIPQAALSLPVKASRANPSNGVVDVKQAQILSWSAGEAAASHDVYFGTDADAVKNADASTAEYKGSRQLGSESYDPGKLEWDTTYYWRVDEVEDGGTIQMGNVWSFTTANFLIVDDMESYNDLDPTDPASNRIFNAWIDGFDNPAVNGSIVGYANPPFAEQTIVHSGNQSMPFSYNNGVGKSEATLTLTYPRDWTENGVDTLAIWYIGGSSNAAETMYVALNGTAGVDNDNPNAAQVEDWTEWRIDLQAFGTNLTNVNTITLGFGNRSNPVADGAGSVLFDDIRLYAPAP